MTRAAQIRADLQRALADPRLSEAERDEACRQAHRRIEQIRLEREPRVRRRRPVRELLIEHRDVAYMALAAIAIVAIVYGGVRP